MERSEWEQIKKWLNNNEFEKIIQYVDFLKEPTYEHLGYKASALNNLRRYYEALDVLDGIQFLGENDALWHYRYGYTLMALKNYDAAEQFLLNCIELDDTIMDAYDLLSILYDSFVHNPENKKKVAQKLAMHPNYQSELLVHSDFVVNQIFDKEYQLFLFLKESEIKNSLVNAYKQYISALEQVIQTNSQLIPLTIGLAQTIRQFIQETGKKVTDTDMDGLMDELYEELIYVLEWFGIDDKYGNRVIQSFIYTMFYNMDTEIEPSDFMKFTIAAADENHEKIVEIFYDVPFHKRKYSYYGWAIQAYLNLKQWGLALDLLHESEDEGKHIDYAWHYWYSVVLFGLNQYELAELQLKHAIALNSEHIGSWQLLEDVYIIGLKDMEQAKIVHNRLETLINLKKQKEDEIGEDDD